jgi:hypothetical protein
VFREQFRRMLLSKLRVVFENAASEIELWSKSISSPMDQQLRDRRQAFVRRRESLERVAGATGGLEARILEVSLGAPLLAVTRTTMDTKGRKIEYSHDLFRGDRTRITVRTKGRPATPDHPGERGRTVELKDN